MTDNEFDALVDDATHAVNNLIPDRLLTALDIDARSDLLIRLNDALTPILREIADKDEPAVSASDPGSSTIAAFLVELIETHMLKCDEAGDHPDNRLPHVASETFGASGNIESLAICGAETKACLYLVLDQGAAFRITVEPAEQL